MSEIIKSIGEVKNVSFNNPEFVRLDTYKGYRVITSENEYYIVIESDDSLDNKYVTSCDNFDMFIGSELEEFRTLDDTEIKSFDLADYIINHIQIFEYVTSNGRLFISLFDKTCTGYNTRVFKNNELIFTGYIN